MNLDKPFSQACENNKQPILDVIRQYFTQGTVVEIGSGTGQHAVFFAARLPELYWQTTDRIHNHEGINRWLDDSDSENIGRPLALDVKQAVWPVSEADAVFSANTAHIMDWEGVQRMFRGVGEILQQGSYFCLYGPVKINGQFTSSSNEAFDMSLRLRDPEMGIRELEDLQRLGIENQLNLAQLHHMPANNVIMVWQKVA